MNHTYSPTVILQGYLAHKKQCPPSDLPRALRIGLLQGPRGGRFLVSEVPLQIYPSSGQGVLFDPPVLGSYACPTGFPHSKTHPPRTVP